MWPPIRTTAKPLHSRVNPEKAPMPPESDGVLMAGGRQPLDLALWSGQILGKAGFVDRDRRRS